MPIKDMTGMRFGKLTVIDRAENHVSPKGTQYACWNCICDCGNHVVVTGANLRTGHTQSCGKCHYKDLSNIVFGRLTAIKHVEPDGRNIASTSARWLCQCMCGNTVVVEAESLVTGKTKSCGCLNAIRGAERAEDLTGNKYGKLTVIELAGRKREPNGKTVIQWKCRCDCGNIITVDGASLKKGNTKSCGCIGKSKMEYAVNQYLQFNHIPYVPEYQFNDLIGPEGGLLSFDFALTGTDQTIIALVECQGKQHYIDSDFGRKQREITDALKRDYCVKHTYPLYEIRYDENCIAKLQFILDELNIPHANTVPSTCIM